MHSASSIFFHCHLPISVIKYSNKTNLAEQGVHCGSQSSVTWKLQQVGGPLYTESKIKKQSDEHMLHYSSLFHLIQSKISGREWNLLQWVSQLSYRNKDNLTQAFTETVSYMFLNFCQVDKSQ